MGLFTSGPKGVSPELAQVIERARKRLKENPADVAAALELADALVASGQRTAAVRVVGLSRPRPASDRPSRGPTARSVP